MQQVADVSALDVADGRLRNANLFGDVCLCHSERNQVVDDFLPVHGDKHSHNYVRGQAIAMAIDMPHIYGYIDPTATHNRGDKMNNANHMQRQAETNYERAMQAARDQYTGYAEEDERNAAWAASYAEYMADCASGESDDWLGYIKEADCILMAAARRDPDAAEAGRKMGEVLQLIWERGAACTADAECERVWGW